MYSEAADDALDREVGKRQRSDSSTIADEGETTYVPASLVLNNSQIHSSKVKFCHKVFESKETTSKLYPT